MPGWTNQGKFRTLEGYYRGVASPTNFYVALVTSAVAPGADTVTMAALTEIAAGNGYTAGGFLLTPGPTDFDILSKDDINDRALIQIKDIVWTASGGPIPASGAGARYAVLTDDNVTLGSREVLDYWDLVSDRTVSSGQPLTLADLETRLNEVP